ncbi:hypothetical protein [Acetivibrio cellulolyticus]|uniref:hypothetical protein n=1 Tax=Acetivibrio cellulolyticus TaxID=35830 RepID=UPI0002481B10|nr:hypothetical protein [Acetivibrio cellulolyticus]
MNKTRGLLETALRFSEFGDQGTIRKVANIAQRLSGNEDTSEFVKLMILYLDNLDILGGGNNDKTAAKARFKEFVSQWLKIKQINGEIKWENAELRELDPEELAYVLGWAGRIARKYSKKVSSNTAYSCGLKAEIKKRPEDDTTRYTNKAEEEPAKDYDMDKMLNLLQKKFQKN